MSAWFFLCGAIVCEIVATLSLRIATTASRWWFVPVVLGYVTAFTSLSYCLAADMPLGVAYGIWSAAGVAIVALLSHLLFNERITWKMALGIVLISAGVLLIEAGH